MAWEARSGLKVEFLLVLSRCCCGLNGLGSPFGIERLEGKSSIATFLPAKWPGKPVREIENKNDDHVNSMSLGLNGLGSPSGD